MLSNPEFTVIENTPKAKPERKWTADQQKAIDLTGGRILVSAAAGSGKTAVLTQRVVKMIENGADISRFLIVTFTKAAAGEMSSRIRKLIQKRLDESPDNLHLLRQSLMVGRAKICTIDAFCADIVKQNFQKCNMPPDFRICDANENELLRREALTQVLEQMYSENSPEFQRTVNLYAGCYDDNNFFNTVYNLANEVYNQPYHMELFGKMAQMWNIEGQYADLYSSPWYKTVKESTVDSLKEIKDKYEYAISLMEETGELEKYHDRMVVEYDAIKNCLNAKTDSELLAHLQSLNSCLAESVRGNECGIKATVVSIRSEAKDYAAEAYVTLSVTPEQYRSDLQDYYPVALCLYTILEKYYNLLDEMRKDKNAYSFPDIAKRTLDLLIEDYNLDTGSFTPTPLALEISDEYDHIMLDEYQDTNLLQELIFCAISKNENNIYCVGDVKQSIYRFRGSMPELFNQQYDKALKSKEPFPALITLGKNFRSCENVIDFVNYFFGLTMHKKNAEIEYDENHALVNGTAYPLNDYQTKVIICNNKNVSVPASYKESAYTQGRAVGKEIINLIRSGRRVFDADKGELRPFKLSDAVILLETVKGEAESYVAALNSLGIPAYCDNSISFYDYYEVMFTFSLLQAIDDPYKDISLAAALRSPIFSFSTQELADIRENNAGATFYDRLIADGEHNEKSRKAVETIGRYSSQAQNLPVYRLVWQLYCDFDLFNVVASMGQAHRREQNLRLLYKMAQDYEKSSLKGLYGFLHYMEKSVESGFGEGKNIPPQGDYVRVMTIHRSKGLEFPIVFLCGGNKKFNDDDGKKSIIWNSELGLGPFLRDFTDNTKYTTVQRKAIELSETKKDRAEKLRHLYVAMTRAREKLYIVTDLDTDKVQEKLSGIRASVTDEENIPVSFFTKANNLNNWIFYALLKRSDFYSVAKEYGITTLNGTSKYTVNYEIFEDDAAPMPVNAELSDNIAAYAPDILYFTYENEALAEIPAKVSVSELKGIRPMFEDGKALPENEKYISVPMLEEGKISPTKRGTAFHRFMQYINLNEPDIKKQAAALEQSGILTADEVKSLPMEHIEKFMESDLKKAMAKSPLVNREYRFLWGINVNELNPNCKTDAKTLVQGVIDMYYIDENGDIVLVDYKTDRADNTEYFAKYSTQLNLYAKALSEITNKKVSKKLIYAVNLDTTILM